MNLFKKIALAMIVLSMAACADLEEILVNPNGVSPDRADAESLYNSVQLTFNGVYNTGQGFTAGLARMQAEIGGFTYVGTHGPTEFDGLWNTVYAQLLPDIDAFIGLAEPLGQDAAAASAKIMKAYALTKMADLFGEAPVSQAGQGNDDDPIVNPTRDDGAAVYAAANALLDEAITQLTDADDFDLAFDNFYDGSAEDWATLARTLKLRNAVTTRLVGGGSAVSGIVASGDIIDTNGENFEFQYGTNRANPNNRHPFYNNSYEDDDGTYQSNWYMWLLAESKGIQDPRLRYYFFRQEKNIFPDIVEDDPNAFDCIFTDVPNPDVLPPHYEAISENMPYCLGSYDLGYFGRDHLNGSGIPPDGQYRTVYGLYPGGGKFDDGTTNDIVQNGGEDGALGGGISPIWQASFTHFMLAEAALTGNYAEGDAADLLQKGIELSIARVQAFESLVDGGEVIATVPTTVTVANTFVPDSLNEQYVDFVLDEFNGADSDDARLAIVAREFLIALYGNGLEGYNLYRRTCYPANIQPGIDPNAGAFIRSAFYPSVHVNRNQNAKQKDSYTEPVFWDTNPDGCTY